MKKVPLRMCLGCRCMRPKKELLRVVKSPDGTVVFDETQKAPGRGAYICKDPKCFELVMKTKALARTLKTAIPAEVEAALKSAYDLLIASDTLNASQETPNG